jgi:hypothetical protein
MPQRSYFKCVGGEETHASEKLNWSWTGHMFEHIAVDKSTRRRLSCGYPTAKPLESIESYMSRHESLEMYVPSSSVITAIFEGMK